LQNQLSTIDYSTMMKEELEDLAGNRLRDGMIRNSKLKSLLKEIWFGNLYYQSALETRSTRSGRKHRKDHIISANMCQAMHISWKLWKEKSLPEH
jgi:hypothetical protein